MVKSKDPSRMRGARASEREAGDATLRLRVLPWHSSGARNLVRSVL